LTDSSEPDPIFAAIERHRKTYAAMQAFDGELLEEFLSGTLSATKEAEGAIYEVADAEIDAVRTLARVVPTTLQGLLAVLIYIGDYAAENSGELLDALNAEDSYALLGSLGTAAKALTGRPDRQRSS
jgi:hypothetical protein